MSPRAVVTHALGYHVAGKPALFFQRLADERRLRARVPDPESGLRPPLVSTARMKELLSRHYLEGRFATGVKKVAWVTSGAPVEILSALGFFVVYPENHAALCGARRRAGDLVMHAENAGFSRDICSYARTDIGAALSGSTPVGRLPQPDLLLCCTNICQTVLYWYRVLAAHFEVPLFVVDTPFLYEEAQDHQVDYVRRQIEELIPVAERVAGRRLSQARLREVMLRSKDAVELWLEILERAKHRPSPITAFDAFVNMGPIVDLRGDKATVAFYRGMLREIDGRIEGGVGAVREESKRVLWDNLPIWFRIGKLSRMLAARGVNVVASTYAHAWGELAPLIDSSRPMDSVARLYLHALLNRSSGDKLRTMRKMIDEFELDGVILHSDRSCKPYSLGQMDQRDRLVRDIGVPALLLEGDHSDPRAYADVQADARLEAFIEMLEGS